MAFGETEIIELLRDCGAPRADVRLGIGDDAALLACPPGQLLVAATDTLVAGVHFPQGSSPASIGHRALAVNLSDLAAMGARPAWALLALTLPAPDPAFLSAFAAGFGALAREHGVALVGGDTTAGPLCITVQLLGFVPTSGGMTRSGGRPGDLLFVSGTPGDAGAGLQVELGRLAGPDAASEFLRGRFLHPTPRVALGLALRSLASACIDVSDGLLGDAGKLAAASRCGVQIELEDLPLSPALRSVAGEQRAREFALTGGDDYELCFAVPAGQLARLARELPPPQWNYRQIGVLRETPGAVVTRAGAVTDFSHPGYRHFGS